jgi:hypothetical protein
MQQPRKFVNDPDQWVEKHYIGWLTIKKSLNVKLNLQAFPMQRWMLLLVILREASRQYFFGIFSLQIPRKIYVAGRSS